MAERPASSPEQFLVPSAPAGCDVSSQHLDVQFPGVKRPLKFPNDPKGRAAILKKIRETRADILVLESTGIYGLALATEACEAGIPVALVNPSRVRDHARSRGQLHKNDAADAVAITEFARGATLRLWNLPDENRREIRALSDRLTQIARMRGAEMNRRKIVRDDGVLLDIEEHLRHLDQRTAAIQARLDEIIGGDPQLARVAEVIQSMKGAGPATVRIMIAHLPQLGVAGNRTCSALAGLAPFDDDSGQKRGTRHIRGGRCEVRNQLYLCAICCIRHVPKIRAYYDGLCGRMSKKEALVPVMRKILWTLGAMIRTDTLWNEHHQLAA